VNAADAAIPPAGELVLVGADSDDALPGAIARVAAFLAAAPGTPLEDVAYTCAREAAGKPCILAAVADSPAGLRERLCTAQTRIAAGAAKVRDKSGLYWFRDRLLGPERDGKIAFLFPGGASFYPGMLRDVAILFPVCRHVFDSLEEAVGGLDGFSPSSFVFPPGGGWSVLSGLKPGAMFARLLVSTCAADIALVRLFADFGIVPQGLAGFAGGDISALFAAGVPRFKRRSERLEFVRDVYKLVSHAIDREGLPECTTLLASFPDAESADAAAAAADPSECVESFIHSPRVRTFSVLSAAAEKTIRSFAAQGVRTVRLPAGSPFNTPWCAKTVSSFRKFASRWTRAEPSVPVYSCADAAPLPRGLRALRRKAMEFWTSPVRFDATIRQMYEDGFRVFVELGPRGNLCGAADEILRDAPHAAIAANRVHRSGLQQLLHALAQLAASGAPVDAAALHANRRRRMLDLDSPLTAGVRRDSEMRLSRDFPRLALFSLDPEFAQTAAPARRGAGKAEMRAAAAAARERRLRQFEAGASDPLISGADTVSHIPGTSIEIVKELTLAAAPFIADCAFGTSQLSYSEPSLRGLAALPLSAGAEMMGSLARRLMPSRSVVRIDDLSARKAVVFRDGAVRLHLHAERTASPDPDLAAVRVQLRDDTADPSFTWPSMEAVFLLAATPPAPRPAVPPPLPRPRSVHWTNREIYPDRLRYNGLLRGIVRADLWSETGLDYEVRAPSSAGAVAHTRFPVWTLDPVVFETITSGFALWRSHPRFAGSFAAAFRIRRISIFGSAFREGAQLRCYMRLSAVTPRSHIADITVSDGNGNMVMQIDGLEEFVERVPEEFPRLILSPASTFLTRPVPPAVIGFPSAAAGTAMVAGAPYAIFEQHGGIWLEMVSHAVLCPAERKEFAQMPGTVSRRAEWLFGRIAAKDAVRRFMADSYQARWTCADIHIWPDDSGKPHAIGAWTDTLPEAPDITIAHTSRLVVAAAAANSRIGIDIEARGRNLTDEFTRGVFTDSELEIAASAAAAPDMTLRFWCAKEAVSKALGTGIRFSPREMNIVAADPATGVLAVRLSGGWLGAFKNFAGRDIRVSTSLLEDHALASCFLPSSLFND